MFSSVELKIAIRYIRSRRTERFISVISWFSFFGITLGVATLIIVLSIQNGLRDELLNSILGFKGHISIISNSDNLYDYKSLANQVSSSKGVVNASPMIESQVLVSNENRSSGALVRGLEKTDLLNRSLISNNIISGSLKDYNNHNSVIVGSRLAAALGVFTNDNITLISPQGTITALGSIPRLKTYKIIVAMGEKGFRRPGAMIAKLVDSELKEQVNVDSPLLNDSKILDDSDEVDIIVPDEEGVVSHMGLDDEGVIQDTEKDQD